MKNLMKDAHWENWLNFFLGVWVFLIPWTMGQGFNSNPGAVNVVSWNFVMIGLIASILSIISIRQLKPWPEWLIFFFGAWLIFSPWFLLYSHNHILLWNSIVFGLLIALSSGLAIPIAEKKIYHRVFKFKDHNMLLKH